jgi:hypothetical protein
MKLLVPEIGTRLVLSKDWTFDLHIEGRNGSLFDALGIKIDGELRWGYFEAEYLPKLKKLGFTTRKSSGPSVWRDRYDAYKAVTIPKGTELTVDRIYIRKNAEDFSSLTFKMDGSVFGSKKTIRFWAKLADVNNIEFSEVKEKKAAKPLPTRYWYVLRGVNKSVRDRDIAWYNYTAWRTISFDKRNDADACAKLKKWLDVEIKKPKNHTDSWSHISDYKNFNILLIVSAKKPSDRWKESAGNPLWSDDDMTFIPMGKI